MAPSDAEVRARLIAGYLGAAERDLRAAELIAASKDRNLSSTAAYHVQQCAEKVAKAVFATRGLVITREHRLTENVDALLTNDPQEPWVPKLKALEAYDRYATSARYPSTMGKLAMGPEQEELDDDIAKVRALLGDARRELEKPPTN